MAIRFVGIDVNEIPSATPNIGTVQDQCIAILTSRYIYEESVLQHLYSPLLNLEFKKHDAWFEQKMIDLDLVYITDKSMTVCCNKGELGEYEEGIHIVTACALVNSYVDTYRSNINVHYIATKLYYEGLEYATYLLCELCRSGGTRDRCNKISWFLP